MMLLKWTRYKKGSLPVTGGFLLIFHFIENF